MRASNKKLTQLKALQKTAGYTLQDLINEAYRILGNPVILYDIDLKILAYAEGDAPFWDTFTHNGMLKQGILDLYMNEGAYNMITNPKQQVMFLDNEHLNHHGIYGKIYDKQQLPITFINVVEIYKDFEDDDIMVVKELCKMLSNEICKIPYYQNCSQTKLDFYIHKLINGDITDKVYVSGYIEMIYKRLKDNLYVAVADISQCDPTYSRLDYYMNLFRQMHPAFKYSVYANYIVIIMSTDKEKFYPRKSFNRLNKLFEQDNIKVGISACFENLFELRKHYNEAVEALKSGLNKDSKQKIFVYGDKVGS